MVKLILMVLIMLSPKQIDFLLNSTRDINICSGSIRSGKTYVNNIRFIEDLENDCLPKIDCLISGRKVTGAYRNVVNPLMQLAEENGIGNRFIHRYNPERLIYLPKNITCYVEGANDVGSEERIRGMTIQRWIADEVTTYPKNFVMQAIGRCSAGKRYKYLTCNPDSPQHYIKKEFIDRIESGEIDGKTWYFNLEKDNPVLDKVYIENIKRLYTGVFYERYIMGRWTLAEGIIYDRFNRSSHCKSIDWYNQRKDRIVEYCLGIDWGYENAMAIELYAFDGDGIGYCIGELYVNHVVVDEKELKPLLRDKGWLDMKIDYAVADKSRPDLIAAFEDMTGIATITIKESDPSTLIMEVQKRYIDRGNGEFGLYYIESKCPKMIEEKENYRWKENVKKDEPIKKDDHAQNAEQYLIYSRRNQVDFSNMKMEASDRSVLI